MKKLKYYFENEDSDHCYTEEYFQDKMKEDELIEISVMEAVPVKISISEYIYCKEYGEVGERSVCGKECRYYTPRNRKNGMCKHRGRLFDHGEEIILKVKNGK